MELIGARDSSLPESPNRLIDRVEESERIIEQLTDGSARLLTISGVGGIGKTRLALEVARRLEAQFRHGTRFVALAACREPTLVLSAIQQAVAPGEPVGRRHDVEVLKRILRGLHVLLVLDNFEQVLDAAPVVSELLATCPDLSVLVTSRSPLRLKWEHEVPLGPLAIPAAEIDSQRDEVLACASVKLLVERLGAVGLQADATEDEPRALAGICRRLDGIPLAIELAADRARVLGLSGLAARLDRPLQLLSGGVRDVPPRHQALRLTFDWSYELLTQCERRIFRHLGVFVGGCTYEAAAVVCGADSGDVQFLDGLERVVESGLVRRVEPPGASESRLVLLEPVREYALERLQETNEEGLARQRHATAYVDLCELANRKLPSPSNSLWVARMNREHANALSALRWLIDTRNAEASLRLAAALSRFWWVIGFVRQGIERVDLALDLAAREPSTEQLNRAHAAALLQKAPGMFYLGKYAAAEVCATEGLGLIGASGAPRERAYGVTLLGNCALARGNVAQAENLFEEALKLFSEAADETGMARSVMDLGRVAWIRQDHARACALLLDCAPRLAALGDLWSAAFAFRTLALAACYRGDLRVAQAQLRQSLRIWRKVGGRVLLAQLLEAAAVVIVAAGRHAQGLMLAGAAATQRAESDSLPTPTWQHELDGWLNRARIAVGPEASSAAWTDGQALSGEAALSAAEAVDWPAEPPPVRRLPASPTRSPGLTARELEILRLVAAGNTNKEIAAQLQVTVATVERHLANAYAKIGARGRAEATAFVVTSEFLATSNR